MNADLLDKLSILYIKRKNGVDCHKEIDKIVNELRGVVDNELFMKLLEANQNIWNLEEEIGKLALDVRKWNNIRTEIKGEERKSYAK